jgi:tetratricopeptide (TPR) repeat protein
LIILYNQKYESPSKPLIISFSEILNAKGINEAVNFYGKMIEQGEKISGSDMNIMGYGYLNRKQYKEALAIFKLNIKAYPEAYNPYDSYGEALLKTGDTANAIVNYKKSVELNPGNTGGIEVLKELGVTVPDTNPKVDSKTYDLLVGKYELRPQFVLTVSIEDDKIFVQGTGQLRIEIFPKSDLEYYAKIVDAQITFIKEDNGKIDKLILHQNGRDMPAKKIE